MRYASYLLSICLFISATTISAREIGECVHVASEKQLTQWGKPAHLDPNPRTTYTLNPKQNGQSEGHPAFTDDENSSGLYIVRHENNRLHFRMIDSPGNHHNIVKLTTATVGPGPMTTFVYIFNHDSCWLTYPSAILEAKMFRLVN